MKTLRILLLLPVLFISCNQLHIEKRKYRPGFHVQWNRTVTRVDSETNDTLQAKPTRISESVYKYTTHENVNTTKTVKIIVPVDISEEPEIGTITHSGKAQILAPAAGKQPAIHLQKQTQSKVVTKKSNWLQTLLYSLLTLVGICSLRFLHSKKKRISAWAARNKNGARASIGGIHIASASLAYHSGTLLDTTHHSTLIMGTAAGFAGLSLLLWNTSGKTSKKCKLFSLVLMMFSGQLLFHHLGAEQYKTITEKNSTHIINGIQDGLPSDEQPEAGVIFTKILMCIGYIVLLLSLAALLAYLSCTLLCIGLETLAALMAIGSLVLVITLAVIGINRIIRMENANWQAWRSFLLVVLILLLLICLFVL